jgi:aryl-alcohol dehydrogenase-like predicted oxidoreductase
MVQPGVTAPITSATSDQHLTDLIEATKLKLDHASLEKLNTVSTPAATAKA